MSVYPSRLHALRRTAFRPTPSTTRSQRQGDGCVLDALSRLARPWVPEDEDDIARAVHPLELAILPGELAGQQQTGLSLSRRPGGRTGCQALSAAVPPPAEASGKRGHALGSSRVAVQPHNNTE